MKILLEENETLTQTTPPAQVSPIYKTIFSLKKIWQKSMLIVLHK